MTEDAERAVDPAEQYARANLPHLCAELLDWHRTALLRPDGHVWHLAHILPPGLVGDVREAERFVTRMALRCLAEQAACAAPGEGSTSSENDR